MGPASTTATGPDPERLHRAAGDGGSGWLVSPLTSTMMHSGRTQGFVWSLNLSLLRVGLAR
jgi:hypothetical protein